MRRLMLLTILVVAGAVEAQRPYLTNGSPNGLAWRSLTEPEKTLFLGGATLAFATAQDLQLAHADWARADFVCKQAINEASSAWFKGTSSDLRREMNAFYQTTANMPIPVTKALGYSDLKLSGVPNGELERYRTAALRASGH